MAFTIGSGTFTNGSATVTGVTLTSGTLAYFASGTRMVVGVNPVIQEVEAIAAPTVSTITLRSAWTGTGGTYSFLANQTSEGLRDAVQAIRTNNASLQSFIDSIDTAATANSVAQRTSDGSLNVTDLNASRNAFIGTTDSNSARLTATSGSGSCIYGNSVSVFSRESGTATQSIIGMNQTGVDAPFIDFRKDGVTVGNIGTSSGDIYFGSGSSGTERMRITSSGNVGIGTNSPDAKLTVIGAAIRSKGSDSDVGFDFYDTGSAGLIRQRMDRPVAIYTNNAERLRIDSSGNVGINTATPSAVLETSGGSSFIAGKFKGFTSGGRTAIIGGDANNVWFGGDDGSIGLANAMTIRHGDNRMTFSTNSAERMRIDSSGSVLIGYTASLSSVIGVRSTVSADPCIAMFNTAGSGSYQIKFYNSNTTSLIGSITNSGNTATAYNTTSDYRLKEDWQPMDCACDRVMQLNPINFAWKSTGQRVDGFLAHELQEVIPEAVTGEKDETSIEEYEVEPAVYEDVVIPAEYDEDGNEISPERTEQRLVSEAVIGEREVPVYQGIDQSKLTPLLTAALQEALRKIEALEARIEALEG